jgi:hypothetical protein
MKREEKVEERNRTAGSMPIVPETKRKGPLHLIAGL